MSRTAAPKPDVAATWEPTDSLVPWAKNPRHNDGRPVDEVAENMRRFGFTAPILARVGTREIIAGHTRWKAAKKIGLDRVAVRFLDVTDAEAHAIALADNRLGELAGWDDNLLREVLAELEGADVALDGLGWTAEELDEVMGRVSPEEPEPASPYTRKINVPVYEPHGPCPAVSELYDTAKARDLLADIASTDLPDDVRAFLVAAAGRHVRFSYQHIAEFYAHAPASVQRLMERSALVVIDYKNAIAEGYVRMTKRLLQIADAEADDADED